MPPIVPVSPHFRVSRADLPGEGPVSPAFVSSLSPADADAGAVAVPERVDECAGLRRGGERFSDYIPPTWVTPRVCRDVNSGLRIDEHGDILPAEIMGPTRILRNLLGGWKNSPYLALDIRTGEILNRGGLRIDGIAFASLLKDGFLPVTRVLRRADIVAELRETEAELRNALRDAVAEDRKTASWRGALPVLKALAEGWDKNVILIQGIVPGELLADARELPFADRLRSLRLKSLQRDPSHGHAIKKNSRREGEIGLELEEAGLIPAPLRRDPTGLSEFVDGAGQAWDVKRFYSFPENVPGRFTALSAVKELGAQIARGEKVILDVVDLSYADILVLRGIVREQGWERNVLWYPHALTELCSET